MFIDGCYWHGCPKHFVEPKTNTEYWAAKIARNRARDAGTDALLMSRGWAVVRVWEHEDVASSAATIDSLVRARQKR